MSIVRAPDPAALAQIVRTGPWPLVIGVVSASWPALLAGRFGLLPPALCAPAALSLEDGLDLVLISIEQSGPGPLLA